jgi:hypothetical protein
VTERLEPVFRISGLEQLDVPKGKDLALATLRVREESGAADGLVQEVFSCEKKLETNIAELEAFRERLAAVGYRRENEKDWDQLRYLVRDADLYKVEGAFPRLTTDLIDGGCPPGVQKIVYDVDLSQETTLSEEARTKMLSLLDGT